MKKIMLALLASLFIVSICSAHSSFCSYKDYIIINPSANPDIEVIPDLTHSDYDTYAMVVGPRSFQIIDATCEDGYVHIGFAVDNYNMCTIDIKDGPYIRHPHVIATSCTGSLQFKNLVYMGDHIYMIDFY